MIPGVCVCCVCLIGDAAERPCCNSEDVSLPADGLCKR